MKKLFALLLMIVVLSSTAFAVEHRLNRPTISGLMFRDTFTGTAYTRAEQNDVTAFIAVENQGCGRYNDLRITLMAYDFDYKRTFHSFDLCDQGDRESFRLPVYMPADIEPGVYPIRVTVSNDDVRRVRMRYLTVY